MTSGPDANIELHPDDTSERNLFEATACIVEAKPANRTYIFPMGDRIDIAFANAKSLRGVDPQDSAFNMLYHSGITLDYETARRLRDNLTAILDAIDKNAR